jgi:CBS domain-containing protein
MEALLDSIGTQIRETISDCPITSARAWLEVGDVLSTNMTTISSDKTVISAAEMMADNRTSCIVVVDEGNVVGILTETDFLKRVAAKDEDFGGRRVVEIMSSPVESVSSDLSILKASKIMEEKHIKRLPVFEDKRLVGIVTQTDLVRTLTSYGMWRDIAEIMSKDVAGVQKTATVAEVAQAMTSRNVSSVVVLDRDVAVGIFSERDFLERVIAQQRDPRHTQIEEIMSFPVISVPSHSSVFGSARIMEAKGVRRLVVTKEGELCGIVTQTDIFRETKRRLQEEEDEHFRLLEKSHNSIYTADLDGQMTYVNPVFLRLFEVSDASEFIGQPFLPERFWCIGSA